MLFLSGFYNGATSILQVLGIRFRVPCLQGAVQFSHMGTPINLENGCFGSEFKALWLQGSGFFRFLDSRSTIEIWGFKV